MPVDVQISFTLKDLLYFSKQKWCVVNAKDNNSRETFQGKPTIKMQLKERYRSC